jgi:hypothetical protein
MRQPTSSGAQSTRHHVMFSNTGNTVSSAWAMAMRTLLLLLLLFLVLLPL